MAVLIFKPGILLSPAGPDCRADFNGDGAIDIIDLGLLGGQWGTDGTGNPEGFSADGIEDGIVNLQDLALLGANWGADCSVVVRSVSVVRSITDNGDGTISVSLTISGNVKSLGIREDAGLIISDYSMVNSYEIFEFSNNEFLIGDSNSEIGGDLNYDATGSGQISGTFYYVDSNGDVVEEVIGGEGVI